MTTISKGDFIEIEYTGKIKENNFIFDTTDEKTAKENNIHNPNAQYGPGIICIGQKQLLKGLDEGLVGKEVNKEYTFELTPENAFGKKSAKLLKLIPISAFKKGNTRPEPGMQVDVDGNMGIVKTVSGGRIMVDFNHPLASKELIYTVKINKIITDDKEKIKAMISLTLNIKKEKIDVKIEGNKAAVKMLKLPEEFQAELKKRVLEPIPTVKELVFEAEEPAAAPKDAKTTTESSNKEEKQPLNTSKAWNLH